MSLVTGMNLMHFHLPAAEVEKGRDRTQSCHLLLPPSSLEMKTRQGVSPGDRSSVYFPTGP